MDAILSALTGTVSNVESECWALFLIACCCCIPKTRKEWLHLFRRRNCRCLVWRDDDISDPMNQCSTIIIPRRYWRGHCERGLRALAHEYFEVEMRGICVRRGYTAIGPGDIHAAACRLTDRAATEGDWGLPWGRFAHRHI